MFSVDAQRIVPSNSIIGLHNGGSLLNKRCYGGAINTHCLLLDNLRLRQYSLLPLLLRKSFGMLDAWSSMNLVVVFCNVRY